jgi:A/G-specific adenine glycosylase
MLQQTQVATVIPYYHQWLRRFSNFASLASASEDEVLQVWQGLGYYARARNLHATAKTVIDQYGGNFPGEIERMRVFLESANILLMLWQALPLMNRFRLSKPTPVASWRDSSICANQSIPVRAGRSFGNMQQVFFRNLTPRFSTPHFSILARSFAWPRKPNCDVCPVNAFCRAKNPAALPVRKSRPKTKQLFETHALIVRRERILLEQSHRRWRGMWILAAARTFLLKSAPAGL